MNNRYYSILLLILLSSLSFEPALSEAPDTIELKENEPYEGTLMKKSQKAHFKYTYTKETENEELYDLTVDASPNGQVQRSGHLPQH